MLVETIEGEEGCVNWITKGSEILASIENAVVTRASQQKCFWRGRRESRIGVWIWKSRFSRRRMSARPLSALPQSIQGHAYLVSSSFEGTEEVKRALPDPCRNGRAEARQSAVR
jgi:hypothetical protein